VSGDEHHGGYAGDSLYGASGDLVSLKQISCVSRLTSQNLHQIARIAQLQA
jgi:hypothetical protein